MPIIGSARRCSSASAIATRPSRSSPFRRNTRRRARHRMRCSVSANRSRRWARKTRHAPRSMRSDASTPVPRWSSNRASSGNRSVPAAEAPVSAREAARLFADIGPLASVILAVSGGPDSTALLFLAARWRGARKKGPKLVAVTVDHGLRPGSAREAAMVKRLAAGFHVEHRIVRWRGRKPATGLQEAARAARYRLLVAAAGREGARHILTAHTRDDQAETVLFRLARGSGLAGLAGIARTSALDHMTLIRPLLDIPKAKLLATLKVAKIPFIEDPSNQDPRFARTRLRGLAPAWTRPGSPPWLGGSGGRSRRSPGQPNRPSRICVGKARQNPEKWSWMAVSSPSFPSRSPCACSAEPSHRSAGKGRWNSASSNDCSRRCWNPVRRALGCGARWRGP